MIDWWNHKTDPEILKKLRMNKEFVATETAMAIFVILSSIILILILIFFIYVLIFV